MSVPSLMIIGDLHLREDTPTCRQDDFLSTQIRKLSFICKNNICPLVQPGDFFHKAKPSLRLLSHIIQTLDIQHDWFFVPGNHDLPGHNVKLLDESGIGVLSLGNDRLVTPPYVPLSARINCDPRCVGIGKDVHLYFYPFGETKPRPVHDPHKRNVAVMHRFVWHKKPPWFGCEHPNTDALLSEFSDYDLIITGDNHQQFVHRQGRRLLINPGAVSRQSVTEKNLRPRIFYWSADDNTYWTKVIPIADDVISEEHLEMEREREQRIGAFVERLDHDFEIELTFEENLKRFLNVNKINLRTQKKIFEALEVRQ